MKSSYPGVPPSSFATLTGVAQRVNRCATTFAERQRINRHAQRLSNPGIWKAIDVGVVGIRLSGIRVPGRDGPTLFWLDVAAPFLPVVSMIAPRRVFAFAEAFVILQRWLP